MNRRAFVLSGAALPLAGCATLETAVARSTVTTAEIVLFWGVVKGMAGVATLADPALAPVVALAAAAIDPLVAELQAGTPAPGTATQVVAQAVSLGVRMAGHVKVVPATA